jgi:small subunit ribosomal protein S16
MIKIRLSRLGTRNKAFYRIVAIDERQKAGGVPKEVLGYWNPATKKIELDKAKVKDWVKKGAQVSPAVKKLIN